MRMYACKYVYACIMHAHAYMLENANLEQKRIGD